MKPGTYTATLYKGELEVATDSVIVSTGSTTMGTLTINGNCLVTGGVAADGLAVKTNGRLVLLN